MNAAELVRKLYGSRAVAVKANVLIRCAYCARPQLVAPKVERVELRNLLTANGERYWPDSTSREALVVIDGLDDIEAAP